MSGSASHLKAFAGTVTAGVECRALLCLFVCLDRVQIVKSKMVSCLFFHICSLIVCTSLGVVINVTGLLLLREAGESDAPTPDCSLHSRAKVVQACRTRSSGVQCESEVDARSKSETVKRFEMARHVEFTRKF